MSEPRPDRPTHQKTADLLPPPPLGRALLFAGIATGLGAAAWGLIAFYGHSEFGALAWAIGGLVGFAIVKAGGHGTLLACCGGALAMLSIFSGKQLAFRMSVDQEVTKFVAQVDTAAHAERSKDAADWVALGDGPAPAQVTAFQKEHSFDPVAPDFFARTEGAKLRDFATRQPSLTEWREELAQESRGNVSFFDYLREDFHPLDIVFALLGIATAFGMVSKATVAMQVAARQALRAEREPAAPGEGSAS